MRVAVLGAGIIGTATAYYLMKDGHEVEVVERQPGAGLETSWGNGAILHASSVQPWAAPGVPWQILRWLGRNDAPLLLRPSALPKMWRWGLGFLRNCGADCYRRNSLHNLALALDSIERLGEIRSETGIAYDHRQRAVLKTYADQAALDLAMTELDWLGQHGLDYERLDPDGCAAVEPALESIKDRFVGGILFPQDELGDCNKFSAGLASWCAERGVRFHFDTRIESLLVEGGRVRGVATSKGELKADAVVVALGSWTPFLLRKVGLDAPIYPVKGVSLTVPRAPWNDAPQVAILDETLHMALVPIGDRLRVVGMAEIGGYDATPDPLRIKAVVDPIVKLFPAFKRCVDSPQAKAWAGLRPVTPTGTPIIGPTRIEGLYINSGHGHTGWTLGCGSGKRMADIIAGRSDLSAPSAELAQAA